MNHIGHPVKKKTKQMGIWILDQDEKNSGSVIIKLLLLHNRKISQKSQKGVRTRNVREKFRCKGLKNCLLTKKY